MLPQLPGGPERQFPLEEPSFEERALQTLRRLGLEGTPADTWKVSDFFPSNVFWKSPTFH